MNNQQATQILNFRKQDTKKLQKKKQEFLSNLNTCCLDYGQPELIQANKSKYSNFDKAINYNPKLKHFEMWDLGDEEPIKTHPEHCQFINLNANTRTKINSETCLEIDKLEFNKAVSVICETLMSLIRSNYNFFAWYAEGQRSVHVRIYDFEELENLNPQQRIKAQIEFWRRHIPFGCFQFVDTGIFVDEHPLQLEYSIHWKYHTPFNLLFEYIPEIKEIEDKTKTEKEVLKPIKKFTNNLLLFKKTKTENHICPNHYPLKIKMYETIENKWLCAWCELDKHIEKCKS